MELTIVDVKNNVTTDFKKFVSLLDDESPADLMLMSIFCHLSFLVYEQLSETHLNGVEVSKIISGGLKTLSTKLNEMELSVAKHLKTPH